MTKINYGQHNKDRPNLVRTILTTRDIEKGANYDNYTVGGDPGHLCSFEMFNMSSGWYTISKNNTNSAYKDIAERNVYKIEDCAFINGVDGMIDGINKTKTVRKNLKDAIKEFGSCFVITKSDQFDIEGSYILDSIYMTENIAYLIPCQIASLKVSPHIAEFVYSEDIHEDEPWFDGKKGEWFHLLHEWATIEIHEPDAIVKVKL